MPNLSKLVRVRIVNLGCIGEDGLVVDLDDIVCLVGANNSGKSTVLRAYEVAVNMATLTPNDLHSGANGKPTTVELWIHIPEGAENIDAKWKDSTEDGLLLVRSKWEWSPEGGKPSRSTWDPTLEEYAADGNAAGLDNVFKSRLPKPFRIGSLEDPEAEHGKLLELVLEPIKRTFAALMKDDHSELRARIKDLQNEASKPLESFKETLEEVQSRVNSSYRRVFQTSEIRLRISLGELGVDPSAALSRSSHVEIVEGGAQSKWQQQGTGSQRALFWSMLEVRSELARLEEQKQATQKALSDKQKNLKALKAKSLKKVEAIVENQAKIAALEAEIEVLGKDAGVPDTEAPFLPGYMLLIDEPETALHPSAIRAAKDHLYSLAAASGWQVMLSTHHPIFVDPLKEHTTIVRLQREGDHTPPNVYRADSMSFEGDERENLKSLLAFDPSVAEMFFGPKVVVVEGDTEFAAFSEVMNGNLAAFPMEARPLLLRARGKATIPILLKMLTHFKVNFAVLHDIDPPRTANGAKKNAAYSTNNSISDAVKAARAVGLHAIHRSSCPNFEQHHGMALPDKDKPYLTWKEVRDNAHVKESVRKILEELCEVPVLESGDHPDDGSNFEKKLRSWIAEKKIDDAAYAFKD